MDKKKDRPNYDYDFISTIFEDDKEVKAVTIDESNAVFKHYDASVEPWKVNGTWSNHTSVVSKFVALANAPDYLKWDESKVVEEDLQCYSVKSMTAQLHHCTIDKNMIENTFSRFPKAVAMAADANGHLYVFEHFPIKALIGIGIWMPKEGSCHWVCKVILRPGEEWTDTLIKRSAYGTRRGIADKEPTKPVVLRRTRTIWQRIRGEGK